MNETATDHSLLQEYVVGRSEAAFAALVARHIDLVYATAVRSVGDLDLARDVTQDVFAALARKAHSLSSRVVLTGWLYQATRYASSKVVRAERRRKAREREASAMYEPTTDCSADWDRLAPEVDAAIECLGRVDRDAVLLRFFQGLDFRTVGAALGLTEGAAKKRVSRALEQLRSRLARRGVSMTEAALIAALADANTAAAPVGLAASVAGAAVAGASLAGGASALGAVLRFMATTKAKAGIVAAIGILCVPFYVLWEQNRALRLEVDRLRAAVAQRSQSEPRSPPVSLDATERDQLQRARREHLELLSLRGRVSQLRAELRALNASSGVESSVDASGSNNSNGDSILFTAALTNRVKSGATLVVGGWSNAARRSYALITPTIRKVGGSSGEDPLGFRTIGVEAPENFWTSIGWGEVLSQTRRSAFSGVLGAEDAALLIATLRESKDAEVTHESLATSQEGGYVGLGWSNGPEDGEMAMLMRMDLHARVLADTEEVQIELSPSTEATTVPVHPSLRPAGGSP